MERNEDWQFDEELSKALTAAVSSRQKSAFRTREEFEAWLREGEKKRKQRQRRRIGLTAAAAVFVCAVFFCSSYFVSISDAAPTALLPWNSTPTYANPDSQTSITEENGSIVIGGDGNMNTDTWTATFASYDDLPEKYKEEIIWFEDMPEGYEVSKIVIEKYRKKSSITIHYLWHDLPSIKIKQAISFDEVPTMTIINQYDDVFKIKNKDVYLRKDKDINLYIFIEDASEIHIYDKDNLDFKKIEALIASIRIGWNM